MANDQTPKNSAKAGGRKRELGGSVRRPEAKNGSGTAPQETVETKRMTLDLDLDRHRTLRRIAFEHDVPAAGVLRALIDLFDEDEEIAERALAAVRQEKIRTGR